MNRNQKWMKSKRNSFMMKRKIKNRRNLKKMTKNKKLNSKHTEE